MSTVNDLLVESAAPEKGSTHYFSNPQRALQFLHAFRMSPRSNCPQALVCCTRQLLRSLLQSDDADCASVGHCDPRRERHVRACGRATSAED